MGIKRLSTLMLALLFALILISCTSPKDQNTEIPSPVPQSTQSSVYDYSKLRTAFEKTNSLQSFTIRQATSVFINMLGMSFSSTIAGNIIQNYENEKYTMQANRVVSIAGSDTKTSAWYLDGTMYINNSETKTKTSVSQADFKKLYANVIVLFDENSLSSVNIETLSDGSVEFSASVSDSEISAYMQDALVADADTKIECSKATVYYIISQSGYITEQNLKFNMSVEKNSMRSIARIEQTYVYINPGKITDINFPDFGEYTTS